MSEEGQSDGKKPASSIAEASHQDASTNVSQTNLTQMTASAQPLQDSGKWMCEECTYENFPLSKKCTMCRSAKPCLNEDIFRLQDGASALPPTPEICAAEGISERLRPLRISSPPALPAAAASASAPCKWACPTCTYENWPKSQKCAMCGAAADLSTSPPSSLPSLAPHTDTIESLASEADGKRRRQNNHDWLWLQACLGVVEGKISVVQRYLVAGGSPARALAPAELALLARPSAFDAGHTLVHLAIRFQRQDILSLLLSRISGGGPGLKRSPSYICPELGAALRRHIAGCVRRSKGPFVATYINEFHTFVIPAEVGRLGAGSQELVLAELVDGAAQHTLQELLPRRPRLLALWNRSAGDCLPDAVSQAAWGLHDRQNLLRGALADTLVSAARWLYRRWAGEERAQALQLHYSLPDHQLRPDWERLVRAATTPKTALHQIHVFVLAHVMRRPILVYGVNVVHSFRGEPLGYAKFQGIYLPLLWEPESCSPAPLCLGYTRGHFSALVPVESYPRQDNYICREPEEEEDSEDMYLPLTDSEGKLLPVHFLTSEEEGDAVGLVRRYTQSSDGAGGLQARLTHHPRHPLLAQLLRAWLQHYHSRAEEARGPFPPRLEPAAADFSSDADTDDE